MHINVQFRHDTHQPTQPAIIKTVFHYKASTASLHIVVSKFRNFIISIDILLATVAQYPLYITAQIIAHIRPADEIITASHA